MIAERLRAARAAANLTQGVVAVHLDCTIATVANWERGRANPCAPHLALLAVLYGVSADWILTGTVRLPHRWEASDSRTRCSHGVPIRDRCTACEDAAVAP